MVQKIGTSTCWPFAAAVTPAAVDHGTGGVTLAAAPAVVPLLLRWPLAFAAGSVALWMVAGPLNAVAPEPVTAKEFATVLGRVTIGRGASIGGGSKDLLNRGRPSVALDLKRPEAVAAVGDVVVEDGERVAEHPVAQEIREQVTDLVTRFPAYPR